MKLSLQINVLYIQLRTAVDCGSLDDPTNGMVALSSTLRGSEAVYTCADNYTLMGVATRVCTDSGDWSEEVPLCEGTYSQWEIVFKWQSSLMWAET